MANEKATVEGANPATAPSDPAQEKPPVKKDAAPAEKEKPAAPTPASTPIVVSVRPLSIPGGDIVGRGIYVKPRQPYELKEILFKKLQDKTDLQTFVPTSSSKVYLVPAGCAVNPSPPLPADQSFGQTLIEESWSRFGKQLTLDASASVSGQAVSIDATAFQANSVKSDEDSFYAMRSSFVPLWDLYMPSVPDDYSEELINLVPDGPFEWQHRRQYAEIFDRFGTHFVKNVWVGGKATLVFTVAKSSNLNTSEIRTAVQASFGGAVDVSGSAEKKSSLETFSKNSSCKVFGAGGDSIKLAKLSEFDPVIYNSWLESVASAPAVIQLGIVGIWSLIRPRQGDSAKARAAILQKSEALREAYVRESSVASLTAIIPIGPYYIFLRDSFGFALDCLKSPYNPELKTLSDISRELSGKKEDEDRKESKLRLENIAEHFPFLQKEVGYRDFQRPTAALSMAVVTPSGSERKNFVYIFKNQHCLLLDFNHVKSSLNQVVCRDKLPRKLNDVFPGVEFEHIDAALAIPPDKVYLFCGNEYYRIQVCEDDSFKVICREKISAGWPGVDFERLDTATYWKNGKIYFFYEDQFIRYDASIRRADPGYPKYIPSSYVEDWDFFE